MLEHISSFNYENVTRTMLEPKRKLKMKMLTI